MRLAPRFLSRFVFLALLLLGLTLSACGADEKPPAEDEPRPPFEGDVPPDPSQVPSGPVGSGFGGSTVGD